ncbi:hypothetical protein CVT26_010180 [Gymnopilus dilepis]|uniref:Uncharacterized protein n=1 Tax=Gymnopilus dilepis TaxID=231916 RepID=A0A409WCU5_9AGAR|nr:hypothetical protein CVT26_010180 [Gymnopilus dilepis]
MSNRRIFVDDNDPAIEYGPGWVFQPLKPGDEALTFTPLYDTLHAFSPSYGLPRSNFTFIYKGSDVTAFFEHGAGNESGLTACTVDGVQKVVAQIGTSVQCTSGVPLADGTHTLFVEVNLETTFDGIQYTPFTGNDAVGDVIYAPMDSELKRQPSWNLSDPMEPLPPGGSFDLDFIGYSLSMYADFAYKFFELPPNSNLTYSIDNYPPQNFTISNPANSLDDSVFQFRVLQTPLYPMGLHHFHLVFRGTNETVPFLLNQIIVQNSTAHGTLNIQPFPTTLSAASSQPTTSPVVSETQQPQGLSDVHTKSHVAMWIGISIGIIAILLLVTGILWYCRRKRRTSGDHEDVVEVVVRPFAISDRRRNSIEKSARLFQSGPNQDHPVHRYHVLPTHVPANDQRESQGESDSTVVTGPPSYHVAEEAA